MEKRRVKTATVTSKKKAALPKKGRGKAVKKTVTAKPKAASAARRAVRKIKRTPIQPVGWARLAMGAVGAAFVLGLVVWQTREVVPLKQKLVAAGGDPAKIAATQVVVKQTGELAQEFETALPMPIGERVAFWSQQVMTSARTRAALLRIPGAPNLRDSAPLVPKRFDCTTFVETVAALARSSTERDFYSHLLAIRYRGGQPSFEARNHFPEADWLPNNERAGILKDITVELGEKFGVTAGLVQKKIDRTAWLAKQIRRGKAGRNIASIPAQEPAFDASVRYIPLSGIARVVPNIPQGAIVNLVRQESASHPVLISHQGIVVREGDQVKLRHALPGGRMLLVPLKQYVEHLARSSARWKIVGINIDELKKPL